ATGQGDWRFCNNCSGLFFDGYAQKGSCPAGPGGGLRLNPVLGSDSRFYPFNGSFPIGDTLWDERPGGAFIWNDRMYVFANISIFHYSRALRPGNPQVGTYVLSTSTPDQPSPLTTEFLLSPRIGKCRQADGSLQSHKPLGYTFFLP